FATLNALEIEQERTEHRTGRGAGRVKQGGARDVDPLAQALHGFLDLDDLRDDAFLHLELAQDRLAMERLLLALLRQVTEAEILETPEERDIQISAGCEMVNLA